eukprot:CAMPEP_0113944438 /NCGR_PEP_ID=MMETSP1339-20121228/34421_1 /TAXON_ID=94617 /ORGANISM="Fibrocapsa japonica" /LENGTH=94 /DNA_ID=CAMNT_0000949649 /DNA_START=1 /DNA_END=285 /DNA_ORIENTATION=- /assembly_acc=CAM_ASM_000762
MLESGEIQDALEVSVQVNVQNSQENLAPIVFHQRHNDRFKGPRSFSRIYDDGDFNEEKLNQTGVQEIDVIEHDVNEKNIHGHENYINGDNSTDE